MARITAASLAFSLLAGLSSVANAQEVENATVTQAPASPLAGQQTVGNWTGLYTGLQFGTAEISGTAGNSALDGDDVLYGVHAGYNYDLGKWVLGGELDYDQTDLGLDSGGSTIGDIDSIARLKFRAGYDLGPALIYGTVGAARIDTSVGNDTGEFYGVGVAYQISDRFVVSGEYLNHEFSDLGSVGTDTDLETFTIRVSLRF